MTEQQKKILIVEDDMHIVKIYEIIFAKEGYQTVFAVTGDEAIEKVVSEKPDIVILDLMLPGKDGFFFLEEIKKITSTIKIPVIVLSNLGQKIDIDRAIRLGADEYMIKVNHSMKDVLGSVKNCLQAV